MSILAEPRVDSGRAKLGLALGGLQRWVLYAGLFLLPLAYSWQTYDPYVLPKLLLARTLTLGLLGLLVARWLVEHRVRVRRTPLDIPLLIFLASGVLSTIFARNVNVAIFGTYGRYDGLLTLATYFALFWLAVQILETPGEARTVVRVLIASGYVVAALAIVQGARDTFLLGEIQPAIGTLGNQNVTGAFLVMVSPLAYLELTEASTMPGRALALNALVVLVAAVVLTFSRSAWLGLLIAAAILAGFGAIRTRRRIVGTALAVLGVVAVVAIVGLPQSSLTQKLEHRFFSVFDLASWGPRPYIWKDSLQVIASRPITGYGPDNFGLVYPRYQTGKWALLRTGTELQIDKAHAEILQVAATQGILGAAAYLLVLGVFVRTFWRGPRDRLSTALFSAWAAYQVVVQLNFTALASAFPFWLMAAAAICIWQSNPRVYVWPTRRGIAFPAGVSVLFLFGAGALIVGVIAPLMADSNLRTAVQLDFAGSPRQATSPAYAARSLVPFESVYAVETGNLSYELGDWAAARAQYGAATELGTYNPRVYRSLALADLNLGLRREALDAARAAEQLDRFDPANQALVDQLLAAGP